MLIYRNIKIRLLMIINGSYIQDVKDM